MVLGGVLAAPVAALVAVRRLPARLLVPVVGAIVSLFALRNLYATLQAGDGA